MATLKEIQSDCSYHDHEQFKTFKQRCLELDINYWRALKRREAGMSMDKVLCAQYVRGLRQGVGVTVRGVRYPNLEEAARILQPVASTATIGRWLRAGMPPDEAYSHTPNPGYAAGFIYLIFNLKLEKGYVGLTVQQPEMRISDHWDAIVSGAVKGTESLHAEFRRNGADGFVFVIIDSGISLIDLGIKERMHIERHGTLVPNGFNISPGGTTGGSNPKSRTYSGIDFKSTRELITYVAKERGISHAAAKKRVQFDRIDVKRPAKAGHSLVKTAAYKAWSRIVHCAVNPNSKTYVPGLTVCARWRNFDLFLEDVGQPREKGMAFTRWDKALGFFPENCQWMTKSESSRINAAFMKLHGTLVGNRRNQN